MDLKIEIKDENGEVMDAISIYQDGSDSEATEKIREMLEAVFDVENPIKEDSIPINDLFERMDRRHNIRNCFDPNNIALWWHTDDVKSRAEDIGEELTDDEALNALNGAKNGHDCNYGITWETFDYFIEEEVKMRKVKK